MADTEAHVATYDTVAVPVVNAATSPVGVIVATIAGVQLHVPPAKELPRVIEFAGHTGTFPVIGPGRPFTVTTTETVAHVVVYDTDAVPAPIAVTTPEADIVATADGVQLQVPPVSELARVIVFPGHTGALPVIGPGTGFTVTVAETVVHVVA